jgi:tRNA threonylcarbamoyladenosine biosynthesis protein TsaE
VRGPITSPTFVIARVHPPVGSAAVTGDLRPALVHADAYRLGSVLELDDLDLDTDTAASVTVVEWGGGLAEGLATDRLEITITPVKSDAPVVDYPVVSGAADGVNGDDRAGEVDDPTVDAPRAVRISAVGVRWEGIKLPLASLADRL